MSLKVLVMTLVIMMLVVLLCSGSCREENLVHGSHDGHMLQSSAVSSTPDHVTGDITNFVHSCIDPCPTSRVALSVIKRFLYTLFVVR